MTEKWERWKKSTASNGNGGNNCVEVAPVYIGNTDRICGFGVRNSKKPDEMLFFSADEWRAFIEGAKVGEFDVDG
jgi:hypothetical protein